MQLSFFWSECSSQWKLHGKKSYREEKFQWMSAPQNLCTLDLLFRPWNFAPRNKKCWQQKVQEPGTLITDWAYSFNPKACMGWYLLQTIRMHLYLQRGAELCLILLTDYAAVAQCQHCAVQPHKIHPHGTSIPTVHVPVYFSLPLQIHAQRVSPMHDAVRTVQATVFCLKTDAPRIGLSPARSAARCSVKQGARSRPVSGAVCCATIRYPAPVRWTAMNFARRRFVSMSCERTERSMATLERDRLTNTDPYHTISSYSDLWWQTSTDSSLLIWLYKTRSNMNDATDEYIYLLHKTVMPQWSAYHSNSSVIQLDQRDREAIYKFTYKITFRENSKLFAST